jgi:hypothetical protein
MTTNPSTVPTLPTTAPSPTTKSSAPEASMDAAQEAHLTRILTSFNAAARVKYAKGQREHGGNLWEKGGLLDMALEEAIDQVIYLWTLKEQQTK